VVKELTRVVIEESDGGDLDVSIRAIIQEMDMCIALILPERAWTCSIRWDTSNIGRSPDKCSEMVNLDMMSGFPPFASRSKLARRLHLDVWQLNDDVDMLREQQWVWKMLPQPGGAI
jgi:hypothetical protein